MQSDPDVPTENVVSFADEEAPHSSRDYDQTRLSKKKSKFQVDIRDIVDFVFPSILQHPLAAGRLFAYGLYGPLDERNTLRTGPQGRHEISVWELDSMCKQIEREDVMSIYLHKRGNMGLLSTEEQESLIAQADTHLKKAKGRAMLPQITKEDIYELFKDVPRDKDGYCSFHDIQGIIAEYREARIQNFKLVYPQLTSKKSNSGTMTQTGGSTQLPNLKGSKGSSLGMSRRKKGKVSTAVAPPTMFQRNAGQTNPDIIKQVLVTPLCYTLAQFYCLWHSFRRIVI
mmetsp:Transcript_9398/g.14159  ORF Transcript_9398/g.14159 Transcript_9398/m.14159 type:complete len:285 (+) Transcript_9398:114-968(+)